jgi:hypothetical protein
MRYGIESKMKDEETAKWSLSSIRNWRVLKWYERKKDRDRAFEALTHRSNDTNSYGHIWEYRLLDADKQPKKRKAKKVTYPEYDFLPLTPFDTN